MRPWTMLISLSVLLIFMSLTLSFDLQRALYNLSKELSTKIQGEVSPRPNPSEKIEASDKTTDKGPDLRYEGVPEERLSTHIEQQEKGRQNVLDVKDAIHKDIDEKSEKKITNILLVGLDKRQAETNSGRADAIILVSMNNETKTINLISFMRDTYVAIPGYKGNKINAAYSFGGIELLKKTINTNFKVNIDKHVVVNFIGFEKVINTLGGVSVSIKDYEVRELNRCLDDLGKGEGNYIRRSGPNQLNGPQVLAYVRMRKVGDGDYERTKRQRNVMQLMIEKSKNMSLIKYPILLTNLLPNVRTNLSIAYCLSLLKDYYTVKDWTVTGLQIPTSESGKPKTIHSMWVIVPDKKKCTDIINGIIE